MTRTDRLLSIVLALQARRWQRAEDLAAMLDVSLRTIYRDMQALEATGIPLVAVPGKGYSLSEGYLLAPLMFTTDEAAALLLGSDHAAPHFDERLQAAARTAAKKLLAVLPAALHDEVAALREGLRATPLNVFDQPAEQARLRQLRRALVEQRAVRFRYGPEGDAVQTVHPYGLLNRGGAWYLVGFSHLRQDVRHFRLARIDDLALLDATFERPAGYRMRRDAAGEPPELTVRVRFDATVARWLRQAPALPGAEVEDLPDGVLVTLRVRREAEVLPWLLGWGAHACVLEPPSLRRRLADEAERIAARYQADLTLLP